MNTTESPQGQPTEPIDDPREPMNDPEVDRLVTLVSLAEYPSERQDKFRSDAKNVAQSISRRLAERPDRAVARGDCPECDGTGTMWEPMLCSEEAYEVPASSTPTRAELLALIDEHSSNAFKAGAESFIDTMVEAGMARE